MAFLKDLALKVQSMSYYCQDCFFHNEMPTVIKH